MARVLLANELGGGLGHVRRLLVIAEALRSDGHEPILAARDLALAAVAMDGTGLPLLQSPYARPIDRWRDPPRSVTGYGDILATFAFDDPRFLAAMVDAWDSLLRLVQPRLLVLDFAPFLGLASLGRCQRLLVGNGYTLPPVTDGQFPRLRDAPPLIANSALLEAARVVQSARGRAPLRTLTDLLAGQGSFVTHLPLVDPYRADRRPPAAGPLFKLAGPSSRPPTEDFFAYLSATYAGTEKVLQAIAGMGLRGGLFLRDSTAARREHWRAQGLTVHETPQPLDQMLERSALFIHHGGPSSIEQAMALGRPQLLVPRHVEQFATGKEAARQGTLLMLAPHAQFATAHAVAAIERLRQDEAFRVNAERLAQALEQEHRGGSLEAIIAAYRRLLSGDQPIGRASD